MELNLVGILYIANVVAFLAADNKNYKKAHELQKLIKTHKHKQISSNDISEEALNKFFDRIRKDRLLRFEAGEFHETVVVDHGEHVVEFSYDDDDSFGPSGWKTLSPICNGNRQSPIAINTKDVSVRKVLNPLKIDGLNLVPEKIEVQNNGHSLSLVFRYKDDKRIRLHDGPLESDFILDNIHFHWGLNNHGSEHVINDKRFAAEMHLVTYNSIYETIQQAAKEPTGLAVLGILFDFDANNYLGNDNPWIKFASKVSEAHSSYVETKWLVSLGDILKESSFRGLLSYKGSLTTPGCSENVLWMISTEPLPIKQNELILLNNLRDPKGKRILRNYRPLQQINGRKITAYKCN